MNGEIDTFNVRTSHIPPEVEQEWKDRAPDQVILDEIVNEIAESGGHKGTWVSYKCKCANYEVVVCTIYDSAYLTSGNSSNLHPTLETDYPKGDVSQAASLFARKGYPFTEGDNINLITGNIEVIDKYLDWVSGQNYPLRFFVVYDGEPYDSHKSDKTGATWTNYDTVALIHEDTVKESSKAEYNKSLDEFIDGADEVDDYTPEEISITPSTKGNILADSTDLVSSSHLEFGLDEGEIEKEASVLIKDNLSRELTEQLSDELGLEIPTTSSEAIGVEGKAMILAAIKEIKGKNNE